MAEATYNLRALVAAALAAEGTAVSEQAARQYVQECLPPGGTGMSPYGEEHLLRLRMAIRLAAQYVPLREIARFLDRLPTPALRIVLERAPQARAPSEGDVVAYLERLLRGVPPAALMARDGPAPRTPAHAPAVAVARPRRAVARTEGQAAYSEWLRVSIDADVELLVRWRPGGERERLVERLAVVLREALAAEPRAEKP